MCVHMVFRVCFGLSDCLSVFHSASACFSVFLSVCPGYVLVYFISVHCCVIVYTSECVSECSVCVYHPSECFSVIFSFCIRMF